MEDIFVQKSKKAEPGFPVGVVLNRKETKGKVGLEIEVEGEKLLHDDAVPPPWTYHVDGSLRGKENAEYVLNKPIEFSEVGTALDVLWDTLRKNKAKIDDSNRTSVHVHLNVQEFHMNRLASFLGLYFTFEEIFTEWCGEHRVGNMFCLRAIDASAIVSKLKKFIATDGHYELHDVLHYGALNAHALPKYGSLEIRTLRGCSEPDIILFWVRLLQRLYDLSADFTDPRDVCTGFSGGGGFSFFTTILGEEFADRIKSDINWDYNRIEKSLLRGIRLAQDLCYCRDWATYQPVPLKSDPFSRPMKKIVKKITQSMSSEPVVMVATPEPANPPIYSTEELQQFFNQYSGVEPESMPEHVEYDEDGY